jgi:hypothetical protein
MPMTVSTNDSDDMQATRDARMSAQRRLEVLRQRERPDRTPPNKRDPVRRVTGT